MRDTITRVELVRARVRVLRRNREKRSIYGLTTLSSGLFLLLAGMISATAGRGQAAVWGMYGSMLLRENVGGYVLVGVVTFSAAVVITIGCMRYSERIKRNDRQDQKEETEREIRDGQTRKK